MAERWILQLCHGYSGPFLDCARQYAVLFKGTSYKVYTVYLTGEPSAEAERGSASDEVLFLGYDSKDVRGLKLGAIRRLREIVASRDFRLCVAHRFKPIYIALLATSLPVIGVHHAFGVYRRAMRRWFINRFRSRLLLLAVSNAVRDEMRAHLTGWEPERIETLYNRIDVAAVQAEQVSRKEARDFLDLPQDAWVVGNVGRLHPDKDQGTLIRGFAAALPQLPSGALLAIAGSGPLEEDLKNLARQLGISGSVRFLGQIPNIRRLFKAFDLFVLSSDHEPFGMVLLEAMAAQLPILATDCGGAPEVVGRQEQLFGHGDSEKLASLLVDFVPLKADSYRQQLVQEGYRRLCETFTDDAARKRFFALPIAKAVLGHDRPLP